MRCSNQLSYEATDVESWSFVGREETVRNECEVIIWHISYIELRMRGQVSYDPSSYERNLCSWVYRSLQKVRTETGFEPMISRYRCDALDTGAPLTAGDLWVFRSLRGRNV